MNIEESKLKEAIDFIKDNSKRFYLTIFIDFTFVFCVVMVNKYTIGLIPTDPKVIIPLIQSRYIEILTLLPLYYILLLIIYSIAKISILHIISSQKHSIGFRLGFKFFFVNFALFSTILSVFGFLNYFWFYSIDPKYFVAVIFITAVPFLVFSYSLINITHSYFIRSGSIVHAFTFALNKTFKGVFSYSPILFIDLIYFPLAALAYSLLTKLVDPKIGLIIGTLIFFVGLAFNRIYYFFITEEHVY